MDRQDIDALLIGALYGELTPSDEARLTAHLDSHPTDRGALDDLKSARQFVRESRIFDLQFDPPQSVSALLLQEAHRRAPKRVVARDEQEGWFYRFTRMFLAHPAMAAAAMLVLVVGVAGTLYMRKGDQYTQPEIAQPTLDQKNEVAAATPTTEVPPADPGLAQAAAGSGFEVGLHDKDEGGALESTRDRGDLAKRQGEEQKNKQANAVVVATPDRQPKDLEAAPRPKAAKKGSTDGFAGNDRAFDDSVVGGAGTATIAPGATSGGAPSGRVATTTPSTSSAGPARGGAPSPPPPPAAAPTAVAESTTKPTSPAPSKPTVAKEAEKNEAKPDAAGAKDANLIAWAKGQHSSAVALASKGDCTAAAKVAVAIQNRAPDYYTQYMTTDRALKKCQAYIAAERDADAERSGKARAQKRVNADEPTSTK
jgi:hypothetical protein